MDWKRIPSLAALRAFEAAVRHHSFTKAAAELNVTQAAITQHVRALEADLAEVLVVRQGRGIAPTREGVQLAQSLQDGFEIIAEGIEHLRAQKEGRPLNISTTQTFASNWLMPRMGGFWSDHPDIAITIHPSNSVVDMRRDGMDLAIRYGTGTWPGLQTELLTDGNFWVVGHPDLVKGRNVTCLADAQGLPWLFDEFMQERRALVEAEGVELDDSEVKFMTSNALVLAGVHAGLGLCIQPSSIVVDDVRRGALVLLCELSHDALGYYLARVPGREPKGLKELLAWLRKQARQSRDSAPV